MNNWNMHIVKTCLNNVEISQVVQRGHLAPANLLPCQEGLATYSSHLDYNELVDVSLIILW
uniref:Uncharacterized protein n=1 Tax=Anguilla anguilla TaxID=7936 RepID=A0A0E9XIL1_ANGAN